MDKVELLGFEYGVLLSKDDEEYDAYSVNNKNLPYGFYDEDQGYILRTQLEKALRDARHYVENGVDKTYAIVSFQGMFNVEAANGLCNEVFEPLDYSYFKNPKDIVYSVCKIDGVIHEGFLEECIKAAEKQNVKDQAELGLTEQANAILEDVLSQEYGNQLFAMANILYILKDVSSNLEKQERFALAQKVWDASYNSVLPLLYEERAYAVSNLLTNGMLATRSPEFPEATPEQMKKLLLTCDIDIFTEIVDSVATDFQDSELSSSYFEDPMRKSAIAALEAMTQADEGLVSTPATSYKVPAVYKEISEDAVNEMENTLHDGFYPTFVDVCVELPFTDKFYPGYTLVVWGEENDKKERFYSVSVCESLNGETGESVVSMFTESNSFDDLQAGIENVLAKFEGKMISKLFVVDHELLVNDDMESVNAYLWSLDGLVDRLPSSLEMKNINFYADYNVRTDDVKVTAYFNLPGLNGEANKAVNVSLNDIEKTQLVSALGRFCKEKYGRYGISSCLDFVNDVRKTEGIEMIVLPSAKSSLTDVIRSASAKVSTSSPAEKDKHSLEERN